jgi:hypothetical protein
LIIEVCILVSGDLHEEKLKLMVLYYNHLIVFFNLVFDFYNFFTYVFCLATSVAGAGCGGCMNHQLLLSKF